MSRALRDVTGCREALARLPELELRELRQQWRALYKSEASPHLSRELLLRAVAYRLQEVALAGSARSASASSAILQSSSTKPERSGAVLVSN
jgi:Protein of unknown function (DUF2924)